MLAPLELNPSEKNPYTLLDYFLNKVVPVLTVETNDLRLQLSGYVIRYCRPDINLTPCFISIESCVLGQATPFQQWQVQPWKLWGFMGHGDNLEKAIENLKQDIEKNKERLK